MSIHLQRAQSPTEPSTSLVPKGEVSEADARIGSCSLLISLPTSLNLFNMAAVLPCTVQATRRQAFLSLYSPSQIFALSLTSRRSSPPASTSSLLLSSAAALPAAFPSFRLPRLASLVPESTLEGLRELLPPWVLAVPKSKTTHSAKKMRSANKGLKEKHSTLPALAALCSLSSYCCSVSSKNARADLGLALGLYFDRPRIMPILRHSQDGPSLVPRVPCRLQEGVSRRGKGEEGHRAALEGSRRATL